MNMRFGKQNPAERMPPPPPQPTPEQATRVADVEKSRDRLHRAVNAYRGILKETKLPDAFTQKDRDQQMKVFADLNEYAGELNSKNAEEGTMALAITALNSALVVRDEVNNLKFQNMMLHKKIAQLEKDLTASKQEVPSEA